jgi:hypothetical protein
VAVGSMSSRPWPRGTSCSKGSWPDVGGLNNLDAAAWVSMAAMLRWVWRARLPTQVQVSAPYLIGSRWVDARCGWQRAC